MRVRRGLPGMNDSGASLVGYVALALPVRIQLAPRKRSRSPLVPTRPQTLS